MSDTLILALNAQNRIEIATTIERLINMLDEMEPDPDLEDGADAEPCLGWTDRGRSFLSEPNDDREAEPEHDEDGHDEELTALETHGRGFRYSGADDTEDSHDAEDSNEDGGDINDERQGPDCDSEPDLGWQTFGCQGPRIGVDISPASFEADPNNTDAWDNSRRLIFDGEGYVKGRALLRGHRVRPRPDADRLTIIAPGVAVVGDRWS